MVDLGYTIGNGSVSIVSQLVDGLVVIRYDNHIRKATNGFIISACLFFAWTPWFFATLSV